MVLFPSLKLGNNTISFEPFRSPPPAAATAKHGIYYFRPLSSQVIPEIPFTLVLRIFYFLWILADALWLWDRIETRPDFAAEGFGTIREDELDLRPTELYSRIAGVFGTKALISTDVPKGFVSYYRLKRLEFGSWDGKKTNYLRVVFRRALEYYDPSVLYLHALSRGGQAIKMLTRQGFVLQTTPDIMNCPNTVYAVKKQLHIFLCYNGKKLDRAVIYNCHADALREHLRGSDEKDNELSRKESKW